MSSPNPAPRALILACQGLELTPGEARLFAEYDPLGFILFGPNCQDREQIRRLTQSLRACVGRPDAPILIDQEGGRVARLQSKEGVPWHAAPPAGAFGALYETDPQLAKEAVYINHRLIAADLVDVGINVNCAPVLDLNLADGHDIIGDRAFSADPAVVTVLGRAAINGLMDGGVTPVIKHIPGHGRATVDSHEALPVVDSTEEALAAQDFLPFQALSHAPWAMTAHITYTAFDSRYPATLSSEVLSRVVRGQIGFDGVLISDDTWMSALDTWSADDNARRAIEAGCDLVLYCHREENDVRKVCEAVPRLSRRSCERLATTLPPPKTGPLSRTGFFASLQQRWSAYSHGRLLRCWAALPPLLERSSKA